MKPRPDQHQRDGETERRWQAGDVVVLRYLTMRDCRPGVTWPCRVVADRDDLVALYVPNGTPFKEWRLVDGVRRHVDASWRSDTLRLMFPDCGYSIWLFWDASEQRQFTCYYVNMEEPFRRTTIGFDTNDHELDVVVTPEFGWRWKDEASMAERVRQGVYKPGFAAGVRAEAERVIAALESRSAPFCDGWDRWTPDPSWTIPQLPANWYTAPAAPWSRRAWAYGLDP